MENNLQIENRESVNGIPEATNSQSMTVTPSASAQSTSPVTYVCRRLKTSLICTFLLLIGTLTVFIAQTYA